MRSEWVSCEELVEKCNGIVQDYSLRSRDSLREGWSSFFVYADWRLGVLRQVGMPLGRRVWLDCSVKSRRLQLVGFALVLLTLSLFTPVLYLLSRMHGLWSNALVGCTLVVWAVCLFVLFRYIVRYRRSRVVHRFCLKESNQPDHDHAGAGESVESLVTFALAAYYGVEASSISESHLGVDLDGLSELSTGIALLDLITWMGCILDYDEIELDTAILHLVPRTVGELCAHVRFRDSRAK